MPKSFKTKYNPNGYIYFILNDNMIKIGRTSNLPNRLRQLQTAMPRFIILSAFFVNNMFETEKYYHNFYKDYRITHEFFSTEILKDRGIFW